MGVIELQSCNISSDTRVYITERTIVSMSQINENIPRLTKAWKLLEEGKVYLSRENPLRAIVKGTKDYAVNIAAEICTCEDHEYRPDLVCIRGLHMCNSLLLCLLHNPLFPSLLL
jgi:hypothetical protein